MSNIKVHLGCPTYAGVLDEGTMIGIINAMQRSKLIANVHVQSQSWTALNMNKIYAAALNGRKKGITHFCMIHADVIPQQPDWLERLVAISEAKQADVLSVVIPVKSDMGVTSTALDVFQPPYLVKRLALEELFEKFGPTFTHEKILLNTGLMLIDLRKPWAEKMFFEFVDRIEFINGEYVAMGVPEDWHFSRKARELGASLWATREIEVVHRGMHGFTNAKAWGTVSEETLVRPQLEVAK